MKSKADSRKPKASVSHSVASPTLARVGVTLREGFKALECPDETGRGFYVTAHDVGHILRFGVSGDHDGKALVLLARAEMRLWIPVSNLLIIRDEFPQHHHD